VLLLAKLSLAFQTLELSNLFVDAADMSQHVLAKEKSGRAKNALVWLDLQVHALTMFVLSRNHTDKPMGTYLTSQQSCRETWNTHRWKESIGGIL
jgi:hypothetical protein